MKIALIGNYPLLGTKSMFLYAELLRKTLVKSGHDVRLFQPKPFFNKIDFKIKLLKKWLGYIDNYIVFSLTLKKKVSKFDIVHICDQANSPLIFFLEPKNVILTCHDLIIAKLLNNNKLDKISLTGKIYQNLIIHFIRGFKTIICVSESTKKDLLKLIKFKKTKIKVIHNALNNKFSPTSSIERKNMLKKIDLNYKYLIHVGANVWYKNKIYLIKIFYIFLKFKGRSEYKLVLVGEKNTEEINSLTNKLNIKNSVINIINPNHNTLCALYSGAEALVFPSLEEGFGWPIIEAQSCGCPVFTSNKPPMSEIGLKSVFYINPFNKYKAAKIINTKLNSTEKIIKKGFKNLSRFGEKNMITKYLDVYNEFKR